MCTPTQMADNANGQAVDPSEMLKDVQDVAKRLSWMFPIAIAGIDQRNG